jgi:hypothetical protein
LSSMKYSAPRTNPGSLYTRYRLPDIVIIATCTVEKAPPEALMYLHSPSIDVTLDTETVRHDTLQIA